MKSEIAEYYNSSIKNKKPDKEKGTDMKPMLAHSYEKYSKKVQWPTIVQPKLDGMRCIAHIDHGKVELFSRTGKPITSVPHIVEALSSKFPVTQTILDGELYNHGMRDNFEKIISLCRKKDPVPEASVVQYHIYDVMTDEPYLTRHSILRSISYSGILELVGFHKVHDESEMFEFYEDMVAEGFEGVMIRESYKTSYENKRSYSLLKYKGELHENMGWEEQEFKIIGINEGEGKLAGAVGSFCCVTEAGEAFNVKLSTTELRLRELYKGSDLWEDKQLTVKFFGWTNKNNVPRFPIGKEIRDYE